MTDRPLPAGHLDPDQSARSVLLPALAWAGVFAAAFLLGLRAWFHHLA